MELKVIAFGRIAEITGKEFIINADNSEELESVLRKDFPALTDLNFAIALNKKVINGKREFSLNDVIALMPPFSGG